jgi:2-polyprenyl-3-methyl-5-hydroxy-6-metoxy-1,4-benzoquinol methylase
VENIDPKTVEGFGEEWSRYTQGSESFDVNEARRVYESYFRIVPQGVLNDGSRVVDVGCGSGRWGRFVAPQVKYLTLVDPSADALEVAKHNLRENQNCDFICESVGSMTLEKSSFDFVYSLGVLHHVPDTQAAIRSCVELLKPGGYFLVYLYYRFDNRPQWFRLIWGLSDLLRRAVVALPTPARRFVTEPIAFLVYWPLSRLAKVLEKLGRNTESFPLSFYKDKSLYVMRTDSRDRFGTRLEQRFTKNEISEMMMSAGLVDIRFSNEAPFWCALGQKVAI